MPSTIDVLITAFAIFQFVQELQGQDQFSCREVVFNCDCGIPGYVFQAYFKQCHYWLPPEQACTRYANCLECESGIDSCISCPLNRYGRQCRGVCKCTDGQTCNRDTGQCERSGSPKPPSVVTASPPPSTVSCALPEVMPPVQQRVIEEQGVLKAVEYSCPNPYTLIGTRRITCNNGIWDNNPPRCGIICSGLLPPSLSDDFPYPKEAPTNVKDCRSIIFNCDCGNPGYKIQAVIKQCHFWMSPEEACTRFYNCLECEDGQDRCALCPVGKYGRWCNGVCKCENGGTCDRDDGSCRCPPGYGGKICEKRTVLTTGEINCQTKGSDIIGKIEVFVNITCPPGCEGSNVWGTSIYSEESSVCAAAIHSGFIGKTGGSTYVVNNGPYANFLSSVSNGVNSLRRTGEGKSFRFSQSDGLPVREKTEGCPIGWSTTNGLCVKTEKPEKAWEIASCSL